MSSTETRCRALLGAGMLAAMLVVLAGCEGDNLFGGSIAEDTLGSSINPPTVTSVIGADSTAVGRTYDLRVVAHGLRPVTRLDIKYRGAVNQDVVVNVNPARVDVTHDAAILIPLTASDSALTVLVTATDQSGAISEIMTKLVRVSVPAASQVSEPANGGTASARTLGSDRSRTSNDPRPAMAGKRAG